MQSTESMLRESHRASNQYYFFAAAASSAAFFSRAVVEINSMSEAVANLNNQFF